MNPISAEMVISDVADKSFRFLHIYLYVYIIIYTYQRRRRKANTPSLLSRSRSPAHVHTYRFSKNSILLAVSLLTATLTHPKTKEPASTQTLITIQQHRQRPYLPNGPSADSSSRLHHACWKATRTPMLVTSFAHPSHFNRHALRLYC